MKTIDPISCGHKISEFIKKLESQNI